MRFQKPVPRYTSYPTVPVWHSLDPNSYMQRLKSRDRSSPASIYIHVPFCRTMCLFCGCHVILNRREDQRRDYSKLLECEMDLVFSYVGNIRVSQLHLGGGTPTYMPLDCLQSWINKICQRAHFTDQAEISIEIDPRTVAEQGYTMLEQLRSMGFNRVSFGVQDTDDGVQEAVRRRQSAKLSEDTLNWARQVGFKGINIDLIYGLPLQTEQTFAKTASQVASWRPSRIALFSYAKVPWMKPHQKAIAEHQLPSDEVKLKLYLLARQTFLQAGYVAIGMDHFALPDDDLAIGYRTGKLQRNFQGYSLKLAEDLIGLGVSSTGFVDGLYVQNAKELESYRKMLNEYQLPVFRGQPLSDDDTRRRWVIQNLMCRFEVSFDEYSNQFKRHFLSDFSKEMREWIRLQELGLATMEAYRLAATDKGRVFIRLLASVFDAYLNDRETRPRFSMSI